MSAAFQHVTVLREEVCEWLLARPALRLVDATLGGGGHAEALLQRASPEARLLGVDRDPKARAAASERLAPFGERVVVRAGTFAELPALLGELGWEGCDGLVADLGVSSPQLDDPERGMSFRAPGPLDMRMNTEDGETLAEMLAEMDERALADVLYHYGEERASRPIARSILRARDAGELHNTADLARCVHRVLGAPHGGRRVDTATRTFQALRIAVNDELGQLEALLAALPAVLAPGGRAALLSFHSLEDRLVKHALRDSEALRPLTKKPLEASERECAENPRARSVKMRVAERLP